MICHFWKVRGTSRNHSVPETGGAQPPSSPTETNMSAKKAGIGLFSQVRKGEHHGVYANGA